MRHISGKMPGDFVLFITFFDGVSCLFRSCFVRVLFWWGMVLHYMHRRYAFHAVFWIAYLCICPVPSMDSISINAYSAIWLFSASFRAFNDIILLFLGWIA